MRFTLEVLLQQFVRGYAVDLARYVVFAGTAYLLVHVFIRSRLEHRRIQPSLPSRAQIRGEVLASLSSFVVFSTVGLCVFIAARSGHTQIYSRVDRFGVAYLVASIVMAILIHDTYFYWTHRLLHRPWWYRNVHAAHHRFNNPTPWAAFAFHPLEALVQAGILPILVWVMPIHRLALLGFVLYMTGMNVLGHLGFELYPSGAVRHWFGRFHNTSTHHNQHHRKPGANFSLYFNHWDRWLHTNHAQYFETFDQVTTRKPVWPDKQVVRSTPIDATNI